MGSRTIYTQDHASLSATDNHVIDSFNSKKILTIVSKRD
jgi:hypothetical protein